MKSAVNIQDPVLLEKQDLRLVKVALERTARWFEKYPGRWLQNGHYREGKCCCLVERFNTEFFRPTKTQIKLRHEEFVHNRSLAHGLLAELAQQLYLSDPEHRYAKDIRFGRVSTLNDFALVDVEDLTKFIRELKGTCDVFAQAVE